MAGGDPILWAKTHVCRIFTEKSKDHQCLFKTKQNNAGKDMQAADLGRRNRNVIDRIKLFHGL